MINIQDQINKNIISSKMILQVHDELVFESNVDELKLLKAIITENMTHAIELDVPLKIDMKIGNNWGNMRSLIDTIS